MKKAPENGLPVKVISLTNCTKNKRSTIFRMNYFSCFCNISWVLWIFCSLYVSSNQISKSTIFASHWGRPICCNINQICQLPLIILHAFYDSYFVRYPFQLLLFCNSQSRGAFRSHLFDCQHLRKSTPGLKLGCVLDSGYFIQSQ